MGMGMGMGLNVYVCWRFIVILKRGALMVLLRVFESLQIRLFRVGFSVCGKLCVMSAWWRDLSIVGVGLGPRDDFARESAGTGATVENSCGDHSIPRRLCISRKSHGGGRGPIFVE